MCGPDFSARKNCHSQIGNKKTFFQSNYCSRPRLTMRMNPLLANVVFESVRHGIYKSLNINPSHALNGTTALHMVTLQNGGDILRVHDVKEAAESIKLFNLTFGNKKG